MCIPSIGQEKRIRISQNYTFNSRSFPICCFFASETSIYLTKFPPVINADSTLLSVMPSTSKFVKQLKHIRELRFLQNLKLLFLLPAKNTGSPESVLFPYPNRQHHPWISNQGYPRVMLFLLMTGYPLLDSNWINHPERVCLLKFHIH